MAASAHDIMKRLSFKRSGWLSLRNSINDSRKYEISGAWFLIFEFTAFEILFVNCKNRYKMSSSGGCGSCWLRFGMGWLFNVPKKVLVA